MNPLIIALAVKTAFFKIVTKKRVVQWGSSILIAITGVAIGMSSKDVKDALCSAPLIEEAQ